MTISNTTPNEPIAVLTPPQFSEIADWRFIYYFLTYPNHDSDTLVAFWDTLFAEIASVGSCVWPSQTTPATDINTIHPRVHLLAQYERYDSSITIGNALRRFYIVPSSTPTSRSSTPDSVQLMAKNGWTEDVQPADDILVRIGTYLKWCNDYFPARHTAVFFLGHGSGSLGLLYTVLQMLEMGYNLDEELAKAIAQIVSLPAEQLMPTEASVYRELIIQSITTFLNSDAGKLLIASEMAFPTIVYSGADNKHLSVSKLSQLLCSTLATEGQFIDIVGFNSCSCQNIENAYALSFANCRNIYATPNRHKQYFPHGLWLSWLCNGSRGKNSYNPLWPITAERFLKAAFYIDVLNKQPISTFGAFASGVVCCDRICSIINNLDLFAICALCILDALSSDTATADQREAAIINRDQLKKHRDAAILLPKPGYDRDLLSFMEKVAQDVVIDRSLRRIAEDIVNSITTLFLFRDNGQEAGLGTVEYDFSTGLRNTQPPDAKSLGVFFPDTKSRVIDLYADANQRIINDIHWFVFVNELL